MKKQRYYSANPHIPKKVSLSSLFECYETNSSIDYMLIVWQGTMQSIMDQNIDLKYAHNQIKTITYKKNHINQQIRVNTKKDTGLFAGIIEKMEINKQELPHTQQITKPKFLNDTKRKINPPLADRSNSPLKRIKDFKDKIVRQNH